MDHVRVAAYHPQMLDWHDGLFDTENIEPDAIKARMSRLANRPTQDRQGLYYASTAARGARQH
jgi:hypothetical protein